MFHTADVNFFTAGVIIFEPDEYWNIADKLGNY